MRSGCQTGTATICRVGIVLCLASFIFLSNSAALALDVPGLQGRVNDYAGMISPAVRERLTAELQAFEQSDSTQIVILTIPSLEGEVIEDFAIRVAEAWKVGWKGKDNGIIFLVAKAEHKIRIEVGRGLEGKLTDLMAGRVIDYAIRPHFQKGDIDGGFMAGVSALISATRGEFKADRPAHSRRNGSQKVLTMLIFAGFALLVLGSMSRVLGGAAGAVAIPALVHFAISPIGLIWAIVLGIAGLVAGLVLPSLFSTAALHGGRHWPGGYYGGFGGGGFGGGGGDFGGGGFGGGGGGFGGGGASGDW